MKKETREQRPGHFPETLWTSTGRIRNELKCEEEYYQQELCSSESPSVKYRFPEKSPSERLTAAGRQKQSRKRRMSRNSKLERKSGESSGDLWEEEADAMEKRPFTTSLRHKFQMDSQEALCLLGLKKKIARMFAQNVCTLDEIHRCTFGNGYGAKRQPTSSLTESEATPVKRRRGRPPKKKTVTTVVPTAEGKEQQRIHTSGWQCIADNQQPLKVKISRSKSSDAAILQRDGLKSISAPSAAADATEPYLYRPRPLRKVRTADKNTFSQHSDDDDISSDDSNPVPDPVPSPPAADDEALALQLHLDLNAPRLRRRRRSGGLLSPSSSEQ